MKKRFALVLFGFMLAVLSFACQEPDPTPKAAALESDVGAHFTIQAVIHGGALDFGPDEPAQVRPEPLAVASTSDQVRPFQRWLGLCSLRSCEEGGG